MAKRPWGRMRKREGKIKKEKGKQKTMKGKKMRGRQRGAFDMQSIAQGKVFAPAPSFP